MGLITTQGIVTTIPDLNEPGASYATLIDGSLQTICKHTHDNNGNGYPIDITRQLLTQDLSLTNFNLSNVRSVELNNQSTQLTGSGDVNCIYVNQGNLGFNNINGVFIPITSGNTLAISSLSFLNFASRTIVSGSSISPATILPTDTYNLIEVNAIAPSTPVYIQLPVAALITPLPVNRIYVFRDVGFNASTRNIIIQVTPGSGNTFATGATSITINNNGGYVAIYTDGASNWFLWTQNMYNSGEISNSISMTQNHTGSTFNYFSCDLTIDAASTFNLNSSNWVFDGAMNTGSSGTIYTSGTANTGSLTVTGPSILNGTVTTSTDLTIGNGGSGNLHVPNGFITVPNGNIHTQTLDVTSAITGNISFTGTTIAMSGALNVTGATTAGTLISNGSVTLENSTVLDSGAGGGSGTPANGSVWFQNNRSDYASNYWYYNPTVGWINPGLLTVQSSNIITGNGTFNIALFTSYTVTHGTSLVITLNMPASGMTVGQVFTVACLAVASTQSIQGNGNTFYPGGGSSITGITGGTVIRLMWSGSEWLIV